MRVQDRRCELGMRTSLFKEMVDMETIGNWE